MIVVCVQCAVELPDPLKAWALLDHFEPLSATPFVRAIVQNRHSGTESPCQLWCYPIPVVGHLENIDYAQTVLGAGERMLNVDGQVAEVEELEISELHEVPDTAAVLP